TNQDIEDLWKLVDTQFADHLSDPGDAVVVGGRPAGFAVSLGIDGHAAELHDVEGPAVQSDPFLPEDDRGAKAVFELDGQHGYQHERPADQQQAGGPGDDEQALAKPPEGPVPE